MKRNVLLAGLPAGIEAWLQPQLEVELRVVETRAAAKAELISGWPSLVVIGELTEVSGEELVKDVRDCSATAHLPIVYCLGRAPEGGLAWRLVHGHAVDRLIVDPPRRPALPEAIAELLGIEVLRPPASVERADRLSAGMEGLWRKFRGQILRRVEVLEEAGRALAIGALEEDGRRAAEREAHKLAGSVGTFGFREGSDLARRIEQILCTATPPTDDQVSLYVECVARLRAELEARAGDGDGGAADPMPRTIESLLLVDADERFAAAMLASAAQRGVAAVAVSSDVAPRRLVETRPEIVVIDATPGDRWATRLELLRVLATSEPPIPAIIIGDEEAGVRRAAVLERHDTAFLRKPVTPEQVFDEGQKLLRNLKPERGRVLVVDDDPQVLEAIRTVLRKEGYEVDDLGDPLRLLQELELQPPDLLVLNLDMPHLSGIELCWLVRAHPVWQGVPIVILTAHREAEVVQRVFAAGADDFVLKPLVGPELITRVANRLERARLYRAMAETDALTGVANRRKSTERFHHLHRLALRNNTPLTFALLDLDRFKLVNDRFGHGVGDRVLREFAGFLLKMFREEDVVGRWGGEEFILGLYGMSRSEATRRLTDAIEEFSRIPIDDGLGGSLHVTFSAGIAEYPTDGLDLQSLYLAADKALYRAKESGRARVQGVGAEERATAMQLAAALARPGGHAA